MGFTGVNTGLIFIGWVTPATRDSTTLGSFTSQGKSLAQIFDAYTPVGFSGALKPEMVVRDMRPARLPTAIYGILSTIFGQFITQQTGSWNSNLFNRGIEYWGNVGRLEEGHLSIFADYALPWTAEWRCMAMSASAMDIPESIQPAFLVAESWLMYRSGMDPRELNPREHPVIEHNPVDMNAPRVIPKGQTTGDHQLWTQNQKRFWAINAEKWSKCEHVPRYLKEMAKVAKCKKFAPGGRYFFEMITEGYTPLEVMESEKMLYATVPAGRPMDNELKGFEEIEAMGLEEECVYGTFVRKFIDKVADRRGSLTT